MPWECVDYSNSLNKHGTINHSPTLSNPARGRAAHFLFCHGEYVGVPCVSMHAYALAHATYVHLYVHAFVSPPSANVLAEALTEQLAAFDSTPVSTE